MWNKDVEVSDDECTRGTCKNNVQNSSTKFCHSRDKKNRMKTIYPDSTTLGEAQDSEEAEAVNDLRQLLVADNLLPAILDDYHMILK